MGKAVCVYCASSCNVPEIYRRTARELGTALVRRGHSLVFGGGKIGLMGILAGAALEAGGRVVGVVPEMLREREQALETVTELLFTRDMRERKALMFQRSDGFIAFPGGFGTWEEMFEIVTLRGLDVHKKPFVLLNVNRYYDPLIEQIEKAHREGFVTKDQLAGCPVAQTVTEALDMLEASW